MGNFIVMQNASHEEELNGGYLWSPQKNKAGGMNHAYERMKEVKEGDIIFSCYNKAIRAVGRATSDYYEEDQPTELLSFQQWSNKGFKVNVEYTKLENPIIIAEHWEEMQAYRPKKYSAFQEDGGGNQAYLFQAPSEWVDLFELLIGMSETETETETETFLDGEIVEEVMARSDAEQGFNKVEEKTRIGKVKKK